MGYGSLRWSVLEVFAVCDVSAALGTILPPLLSPTPLPVIPSSHLGCLGSLRYHLAPSTAPSRLHPSRYLRHLICDVSAALDTILPPSTPPSRLHPSRYLPSSHLWCVGSLRYHPAPLYCPLHSSRYLHHFLCDASAALGTILPPPPSTAPPRQHPSRYLQHLNRQVPSRPFSIPWRLHLYPVPHSSRMWWVSRFPCRYHHTPSTAPLPYISLYLYHHRGHTCMPFINSRIFWHLKFWIAGARQNFNWPKNIYIDYLIWV